MIIAREIHGRHRDLKTRINYVLFGLFFVLPFIRINGEPLILLDIPHRKFHIFGLTIWPQELYFLHLLLLTLGIMLFFFTALFGRIWCGYACPQTIFTEAYNRVARWVSGANFGKKTFEKWRWGIVVPVWVGLSLIFSFVFLGYFMRYEDALSRIINLSIFDKKGDVANWAVFLASSTGAAFFNMIYFRENLCKYVCPYGRFQTALLDKHSPIVAYDISRGEPRREKGQKLGESGGDCTACNMCNLVCPTGIDIREGLQIGCITCGLCVDACTIEMAKFNKATLIDYKTVEQTTNPGAPVKRLRPRTLVYGTLILIALTTFTILLNQREPLYIHVLRDKGITNLYMPGVGVMNGYELQIANLSGEARNYKLDLEQADGLILETGENPFPVSAGVLQSVRFILRQPDGKPGMALRAFRIKITTNGGDTGKSVRSVFSYPAAK